MADLKYYDVILKPVVTEKSMTAMGEKKHRTNGCAQLTGNIYL